MNYRINDIQYLREKTGFGIMDCKKALTDTDGNLDEAFAALEAKGLQIQDKKTEKISEEGIVYADIHNSIGVILEVSAETDFVARSPEFLKNVIEIGKLITEAKPTEELIRSMVMKFRENIQLKRFDIIERGFPYAYNHGNGKYAVIFTLEANDVSDEVKKDLAMQIIAMKPKYISSKKIPDDILEAMKNDILKSIHDDSGLANKPQIVLDKILVGRMEKIIKDLCLIDQPFIKDEKISVGEMLTEKSSSLIKPIRIENFYRYEKADSTNKCACANNMFIG